MRCGHRQPSSCWKGCTRIGGSAGAKSEGLPRKRSGGRREKRGKANGRTSGDSTTKKKRSVMKWIRYSKYSGEDMGIGAEELLQALADFLLESGFNSQYMPFSEWNQHTLEDLKRAIQEALEKGKLFDDQSMQE